MRLPGRTVDELSRFKSVRPSPTKNPFMKLPDRGLPTCLHVPSLSPSESTGKKNAGAQGLLPRSIATSNNNGFCDMALLDNAHSKLDLKVHISKHYNEKLCHFLLRIHLRVTLGVLHQINHKRPFCRRPPQYTRDCQNCCSCVRVLFHFPTLSSNVCVARIDFPH